MNYLDLNDLDVLDTSIVGTQVATAVAKKNYAFLQQHINATSYSQVELFHGCPRKYFLAKHEAMEKVRLRTGEGIQENIDFAFGHAVGAGVQSFLLYRNLDDAIFECATAWRADFEDSLPKKKKSLWQAIAAVESFVTLYNSSDISDWELFTFPDGTVGIEVSYELDCENGYKHYGHIDLVMKNKITGRIGVFELKTHGFQNFEESIYMNSAQGPGYAVVLDALIPGLSSFDVKYVAYSAPGEKWDYHDFPQNVRRKTDYLLDLVTTHSVMQRYQDMHMWPKRGGECYTFNRRCKFYGECDLLPKHELPRLQPEDHAEEVNFKLTLSQVVQQQKKEL